MLYKEAISRSVLSAMESDFRVILLGEGVADPLGIFGTCLSARKSYPERVIETPLSETMLTGACVGLALEGWKPIYVHARFDFALFTFEHLINTAAKLPFLQKGRRVPIVLRVLVGRGWGQGPTHGQNFIGTLTSVPGIGVYVPVYAESYGAILREALEAEGPSVIVEHRRFYDMALESPILGQRAAVQVVTVGDTLMDALEAARLLARMGISCSVIPLERLTNPISLPKMPTVFAANSQLNSALLGLPPHRTLCPPFQPLPASHPMEQAWYVSTRQIIEAVCGLLDVEPLEEMEGVGVAERDGRKEAF